MSQKWWEKDTKSAPLTDEEIAVRNADVNARTPRNLSGVAPIQGQRLAPLQTGPVSLETSMQQEIGTNNPLSLFNAGVGIPPRRAYETAKGMLSGEVSPTAQQNIGMLGQVERTMPGMLGSIAGTTGMTYLPSMGVARGAATLPGAIAPLANAAGQTSLGALYGASQKPMNPAEGGAEGAMLGLGASLASTTGREALTGAARPMPGTEAEALQAQGVSLTPGAAMDKKRAEDAMRAMNAGVPKAQNRMFESWDISQLKRIAPDPKGITGKAGFEANNQVRDQFKAAFDAADKGKTITADAPFLNDALQGSRIRGLDPASAKLVSEKLNAAFDMVSNGADAKAVRFHENYLNGLASAARNNKDAPNPYLAQGYEKIADALEGLRGRLGMATPDLDRKYAEYMIMMNAAAAPGAMETGVFTPQGLSAAVRPKSTKIARALGDALLQPEAAIASRVIGPTIPTMGPGTAEKHLASSLMLGAGPAALYALRHPEAAAYMALGEGALYGAGRAAYSPLGTKFLTGEYPWQTALQQNWNQYVQPAFMSGALSQPAREKR